MYEHIKPFIRQRLKKYLAEHPPQDGQLLAVRYDDSELADTFAEAVTELEFAEETTLNVNGTDNETIALRQSDGVDVYAARVLVDVPSPRPPIKVTQAGSSGLRNYILDKDKSDKPAAGLLIIDWSTDIETLDPAEFLTDDGNLMSTERIVSYLLNPETVDSDGGKAVIKAVSRFIEEELGSTDGTSLIEELARIRAAIDDKDPQRLGHSLGQLPDILTIDIFEDEFFTSDHDVDAAADEIYVKFCEAKKHVKRLRDAFARGVDTETKLKENYKQDDFIDKYKDKQDWAEITFSEAQKGQREIYGETSSGSNNSGSTNSTSGESSSGGSTGGSTGGKKVTSRSGSSSTSTTGLTSTSGQSSSSSQGTSTPTIPKPESVSLDVDDIVSRGPLQTPYTNADRRHVVRCKTDRNQLTVTLGFSDPLSPVDYVCNPSENGKSVTVSGSDVEFSVDVTGSGIQWEEFEVYVDTEDKRGYPTFQVHLAILPEWWYDSLGEIAFDINYDPSEGSEFVLINQDSFEVTPPEPYDDRESKSTTINTEGASYVVERPETFYPDPPIKDQDVVELSFSLKPDSKAQTDVSIPIRAYRDKDKISQLAVRLPLMLDVVISPDRWSHEGLTIETDQVNDGNIKAGGNSFTPQNNNLEASVAIEEEFVQSCSPAPRITNSRELQSNTDKEREVTLSDPLEEAYTDLFDHFESTNSIPSADPWSAETITKVQRVVKAYINARDEGLPNSTYTDIRDLGVIKPQGGSNRIWISAFNPIMLAYGLRIAEWRNNKLVSNGLTEGFRDKNLAEYLNPTGLLPYRSSEADESDPLHSQLMQDNSLWMSYSPTESYDAETPPFMKQVVKNKAEDFYQTFTPLFDIHSDRPLTINFLNLGTLDSCITGLFDFFKSVEEDGRCPPIELRIYGDGDQDHNLEQLYKGESQFDADQEVIDRFKRRLSYTQPSIDEVKEAHLTFFRGVLSPSFFDLEMEALPDRLLRDGLLPQEVDYTDSTNGTREYENGFSGGTAENQLVQPAARFANQLEHGYSNEARYSPRNKIVRKVVPERKKQFNDILSQSSWAVHVQPPVGLEFYTDPQEKSNSEESGQTSPLVIHYDNGLTASPGYDVITTTSREELYVDALQTQLRKIDTKGKSDPARVLDVLAAIEGGSVTQLQRANPQEIKYFIGTVGTMILSQAILRRFQPDYAWVAINTAKEMQHDRAARNARPRIFPVPDDERASDDLMFVGIPMRDSEPNPELKLWFAEAKGGTASASSGVPQVEQTIEHMASFFEPDEPFADTEIFRTAVGELICEGASRLGNYGLLTDDEINSVETHKESLLNGNYSVSLLEDRHGARGESVNVGGSSIDNDVQPDDSVRTIEVSASVFGLLEDLDLDSLFRELNVDDELGF